MLDLIQNGISNFISNKIILNLLNNYRKTSIKDNNISIINNIIKFNFLEIINNSYKIYTKIII
jgi:hypothetical protein